MIVFLATNIIYIIHICYRKVLYFRGVKFSRISYLQCLLKILCQTIYMYRELKKNRKYMFIKDKTPASITHFTVLYSFQGSGCGVVHIAQWVISLS